jgi:hypothetical protein
MRTDVGEGLVSFRGVRDMLVDTEIKPELGTLAKPVETLDDLIKRLTAASVSQDRSARAQRALTSAVQAQARRLRRVYLQPVAEMGKNLAKNDPTLFRAVAMPTGRGHERLIVAANAMADEAEDRRDAFVAAGFGEHFPSLVRQAALEIRQTLDARRVHRGQRATATLSMLEDLAKGRALVRLLDKMVRPWLEEHASEKVGEWKTLTRIARRKAADATSPAPTPTPANPEANNA